MRIAVVADIHGNLPALESVLADLRKTSPDLVVHGGDVASHGSSPAEVIDLIRELDWPGVRGNTDEMLWNSAQRFDMDNWPSELHGLRDRLFNDIAPATVDAIGSERLGWLRGLPVVWSGHDLRVVHATPGDLWRAPKPDAEHGEFVDTYGGLGSRWVVYGHLHRPFVRRFGSLTVANAGSVGLPYDGDSRASYALVDERLSEVTVRRVAYDVRREVGLLKSRQRPHADWLGEILLHAKYVPVR